MTRLYGRALRGQRVHDSVPNGTWHTTTMIAAVSADGPRAPFVFSGATSGDAFRVYVEHVLVPSLGPEEILVMDNLSSHKDHTARQMILATGAQIWDLPPYSPDFNPIEKMWSKVKTFLRKVKARTLDDLTDAIGDSLLTIAHKDVIGWFASCGYSIS